MITRRRFFGLAGALIPAGFLADALLIEPSRIKVTHLNVGQSAAYRIVHFSDLHYKGGLTFLKKVVLKINDLSPDFVCFTGDIVEKGTFLQQALDLLSSIRKPLYGVPGNHDYWSGVSFEPISSCFESTGGAWLEDRDVFLKEQSIQITGHSGRSMARGWSGSHIATQAGDTYLNPRHKNPPKRILLTHYPALVHTLGGEKYDLMLAGHSHGGQVRLPFLGALMVPFGVEGFEAGLYSTPAGPLYVNIGIGTWLLPVRFLCPPEITVVEL